MKGLYQEKKEYQIASFNTYEGIFEFIIHTLIWGYIIIEYTPLMYQKIFDFLNFLPLFLQPLISYIVIGIVLIPAGMIITWVLTKIFKLFFKNGKIFK